MSIDWITVAAQIINFLVLVWLLKRFLYRPILDGIDARERQIAERMAQAGAVRAKAEAAEADFRAQIAKLKAGREGVIEDAREAAERERDQMLAEANARLQKEQAVRADEREKEARKHSADLHAKGAAALLALLRKALRDLADESLEQRIITRAAGRMPEMMGDLTAAAGSSDSAVIVTHDPLPQDLAAQLRAELQAAKPGISVAFQTDPAQSPGLSLRLGGAQLGWTVDSYMDGLEKILGKQEHAHAQ
ncbi:F0F1 ATP synthase subunit B (plasmid) [Pseudorhodobacter turbinis]|uniref:ATP synthase subunit b n=1 Tax=Pseudorhodobacter turbinis TaxID=2500533 RepID=A0A4P8EL28_9RHOB|nr:F0F1 ATP synthase subunit B [Pseudorhodobacter turbinis]QCO57592.1 F0F1 ATP synthase subunit B [Pseudorhodobacter turbinis]